MPKSTGRRTPSTLRGGHFIVLIAFVAVYYLFLLSNGTFRIFAPELLDRVFDSMLTHLLHGEFNVDREAIDYEAITYNGKTYTYFAIFPALLRLSTVPFTDSATLHFARLSCLAAVVTFVALQLRTLLTVHNSLPGDNRMPSFLVVVVAAVVLSGPQLYILGSAWVYHEPILWAAVFAAAFNLVVVRAAFGVGSLRTHDLMLLAAFAGLAFNTRAPIGVALYLGTALLVVWTVWLRHGSQVEPGSLGGKTWPLMHNPSIWAPALVLGLLAGVVGLVNFERWGNPFTFGGDDTYWTLHHPEISTMVHYYGLFNLSRIWMDALYYATGIPYVLKSVPAFSHLFRQTGFEAPPIIPFLTNPITILLAGTGLYRLSRAPGQQDGRPAILRLALIGHAVAVLLILAFFDCTLRYRLDLAPFMTLAMFVGYRSLSISVARTSDTSRRRLHMTAVGLCVLGIVGSHYMLIVHKVWSIGVPMDVRRALLPIAPFARAALAS
jgi:hypothetical protein